MLKTTQMNPQVEYESGDDEYSGSEEEESQNRDETKDNFDGPRYTPRETINDAHPDNPLSTRVTVETLQNRRGSLNSKYYSGHVPSGPLPTDALRQEVRKGCIVGYQGHLHGIRSSYGQTFEKSINDLKQYAEELDDDTRGPHHHHYSEPHFGEQLERRERYQEAVIKLHESHLNQQMLLQLVQAKLQERVNSHSEQVIKLKKIFQAFDLDDSGELDEWEFRKGLELLNVQLSEVQVLSLFALFDTDSSGSISYEKFGALATLPNPKGGTAVYPKPITMTREKHEFMGRHR